MILMNASSPNPTLKRPIAKRQSQSSEPDLWNGLVGAFVPMLGISGGLLVDATSKRAGTINGSVTWERDGKNLHIGGFSTTAYVQLPAFIANLPTGSFSFTVRLRATTKTTPAAIAWNGTDDLICYWREGNNIRVFWRDLGGNLITVTDGVTDSNWHDFTMTCASGSQVYYTDGVQVGTSAASLSGAGPFSGCRIGNWGDSTSQNFSNGDIASVLFHNRKLTPAEVRRLHRSPIDLFIRRTHLSYSEPVAAPTFNPAWGSPITKMANYWN